MLPSFNFPQLDFVKPSSGFHPVTWERVTREHEMRFPSSLLVRTFASPCFGYEPKVKVTIITPLIFFNKEVGRYEKVIVFFKRNNLPN